MCLFELLEYQFSDKMIRLSEHAFSNVIHIEQA